MIYGQRGRPLRLLPLVASTYPRGRGKALTVTFLALPLGELSSSTRLFTFYSCARIVWRTASGNCFCSALLMLAVWIGGSTLMCTLPG